MRTSRRKRSHKKTPSLNARKAKRRRKYNTNSVVLFDSITRNTVMNLENINEVLRTHKTNKAEGRGSWKVMPKDSCEVYKKRKQREAERRGQSDQSTDDNMSEDDYTTEKKKRTRVGRNVRKTKRSRRRYTKRKNDSSYSSISLPTTCTYSTCTSSLDMDYD